MLLRLVFALATTAMIVWLLADGLPLGAIALFVAAVAVRQRAENWGKQRSATTGHANWPRPERG